MNTFKRVITACSLAMLIAGATEMSAQAATSSANGSSVSSPASHPGTVQPFAMPGCTPFNDGEIIYYKGKYWECLYFEGLGWVWFEIPPPPPGCGAPPSQYARETASRC